MWKWALEHQTDILIAIILAATFAIIFGLIIAVFFEAFGIGSRIRDSLRRAKNNSAGRSIYQLSKRIADQEAYRNGISSDFGLTMVALRTMFVTILTLTLSLICLFLRHIFIFLGPDGPGMSNLLDFAAAMFLIEALIGGLSGIRIAGMDTKEKANATIKKLDDEIARMKEKMTLLAKNRVMKAEP
jgi:hypothetical protein